MAIQDPSQPDCPAFLRKLAALGAVSCILALAGCGAGVANLLPGVSQPASSAGPSGPVLGYVFSPTDGTLRAMLGVKGSAQMSSSIVPAGVYVAGEASTASSAALLEDAAGSLFAFNLPQTQPMHVADGLPANAQIVFASSGNSAIVYGVGGTSISLVTGLPSAAMVQVIHVPSANALSAAILSDAGSVAMASAGTPVAIGTLSSSGQFSRVTTVAAFGGFNFVPGSDDVLVGDAGANAVSLIRSFSTAPSTLLLNIAGLNHPFAVAGSQDKRWAIIADGGDAGIFRVDLTAGTAAARLVCACQPTQLNSLAGGGAFRVNSTYSGPIWTVDLTSAAPQMLFVPAIAQGTP